jgi:putative membrane protein
LAAPTTGEVLAQWTWDPSIIIGIVLISLGYAYAAGPLRRRRGEPPFGRGRIILFITAQVVLILALISPLDDLGDEYLFSAHMIQHLLLASLWPPLLLLSLPGWLVAPIFRWGVTGALAGFLVHPAIAIIFFNVDIYLWHIPALYDLTLTNEGVHIFEHLTFMAFGLINWWPVLSPIKEQRLSYPLQVLYLFGDGMFMMVLGIVFTFSPIVFYAPYLSAPRLWGISALTDQQLGGLIMWYPGNIPYAISLIAAFYKWFEGGEGANPAQSPTIGPHLS